MSTTHRPGFLKLVRLMVQAWRVRGRGRKPLDPVAEIHHPARRRTDMPARPAGPEAG